MIGRHVVDQEGAVVAALRVWLPTLGVTADTGCGRSGGSVQERHLVAWREQTISFAEQRRRRLRDFLPAVGSPCGEPSLDDIFEGYLRAYEELWRAFDDVEEALADLARLGWPRPCSPTARASSRTPSCPGRAGRPGRAGLDGRGSGGRKPDPGAFRLACECWGLPRPRC